MKILKTKDSLIKIKGSTSYLSLYNSSGSSSPAIIDVEYLPTENIQTQALYRLDGILYHYVNGKFSALADENRINLLKENYVPKRLSLVNNVSSTDDRSKMYLYVDNNGTDGKISIRDVNKSLLRTTKEVPSDLQVGEYIFLEMEEK